MIDGWDGNLRIHTFAESHGSLRPLYWTEIGFLILITKLIWTLILMFYTQRLNVVLHTETLICASFYDCCLAVLARKKLKLKGNFHFTMAYSSTFHSVIDS